MSEELKIQNEKKEEMTEKNQAERTREGRVYIPRVDIYENNDTIFVIADIPGVDESSIDITLEKNTLTIDARVQVERPEGYSLTYAEYGIGDFRRKFSVSDEIDREKIEAKVKNGVLKLILPKTDPAKAQKILVRVA
ncbi:MAG: heat-shock protein Hsp20 [Chloroflexi bacterium HGW-Chloroflexi-10]|jgi:HSP20 family molecular chaperone IbpA|nr:MAG: heat-shock protein Hsp20 [Chloroflexi bacterium HGW-Chloroflexi-10]